MPKNTQGRSMKTVELYRTESVHVASLRRDEPLHNSKTKFEMYDAGFAYHKSTLPRKPFATVEEALAALRAK